jgi:uncharacterized damage-inducible protein DinB
MKSMDTLTTIFSHNLWANLKLIDACTDLSIEQLNTPVLGTYGSIFATFRHIARAEQSYFSRISTGLPYHRPEGTEEMGLAEIRESLSQTGEGLINWSHKIGADDIIVVDWDGTLRDVPKVILMNQAINHATEHRAQIMVIMTQLGLTPPSLDSWTYFDKQEGAG